MMTLNLFNLSGKTAIVTGGSRGLGRAIAIGLGEAGAQVVVISRTKKLIEETASEIIKIGGEAIPVPADVTKVEDIEEMKKAVLDKFGKIDILINCAGQGYDAPMEKTNINTFHYIFDLDVVGPLVAMQQVIPIMRKQGGGTIINISSGTALMHLPNMSAYSSLKRALADISLTAREELKKDNITVSVMYPFMTLTDFEKNTIKDSVPEEEEQGPSQYSPDTAEYVAQKMLEGIESGEAEIFPHDWMKKICD